MSAKRGEAVAGWLFAAPGIALLATFVLLPMLLALWVSVLDWDGTYSPLSGRAPVVGLDNYAALLTEDGLARRDFALSVRNTFYFVVISVPVQTALALGLAMVVHNRTLRGRGFFRAAFYFPSVTSAVAISVVFLFLFSGSGAINAVLGFFGIDGPTWFADPRGVVHELLGALGLVDPSAPPEWLSGTRLWGLTLWEWLSGPSVAMSAVTLLMIWTTSGNFMLIFLAALQNLPEDVLEAADVDGTTRWQRLTKVTVPMLMPTVFVVLTMGLIGSWQVFDQIYVMGQGNPAKTTLTPAYLSYQRSFAEGSYGLGAAIAFLLFAIIVVLTWAQRRLLRDGRTS
ncbi:sugar ABC transporter permease [Allokutzneria multivorans]|uniref:Sugar ABC transporter permease n=1 Tax=Allokutzneria multivorans TaxID=1142134 RepID=A0ABP7SYE8_9PSEU